MSPSPRTWRLCGDASIPPPPCGYEPAARHSYACAYDERTENTLMNRLLKTAALRLILHGDIAPARKNRLKSTLLVMGGIELMSANDLKRLRWETLRFHRGNRSYRLLSGDDGATTPACAPVPRG